MFKGKKFIPLLQLKVRFLTLTRFKRSVLTHSYIICSPEKRKDELLTNICVRNLVDFRPDVVFNVGVLDLILDAS